MNLTIKAAASVVAELKQSNEKTGTKRKAFNSQKHVRRFLKEKIKKHSNVWSLY